METRASQLEWFQYFEYKTYSSQLIMSLPQLIEDLQRLSEDQDSADVVFICGRDERIYAHRLMLMAR